MSQVDALREMYPRPRVGQGVKLRNGKKGEVVIVRRARDVLRQKTEASALLLGPRLRALFGKRWIDLYYEADIVLTHNQRMVTIDTTEVVEVFDLD